MRWRAVLRIESRQRGSSGLVARVPAPAFDQSDVEQRVVLARIDGDGAVPRLDRVREVVLARVDDAERVERERQSRIERQRAIEVLLRGRAHRRGAAPRCRGSAAPARCSDRSAARDRTARAASSSFPCVGQRDAVRVERIGIVRRRQRREKLHGLGGLPLSVSSSAELHALPSFEPRAATAPRSCSIASGTRSLCCSMNASSSRPAAMSGRCGHDFARQRQRAREVVTLVRVDDVVHLVVERDEVLRIVGRGVVVFAAAVRETYPRLRSCAASSADTLRLDGTGRAACIAPASLRASSASRRRSSRRFVVSRGSCGRS